MATIDRYAIQLDISQAAGSINQLKTALGGLAAAFSLREIGQFVDSITNIRNRLRLLSPNVEEVNRQFDALVNVANRSRTSLQSASELYFRIARSAKDLGINSAEAASVTETVAKAISASGISASEASGPLLQLGQALQSGRLQGDELRSILEGLPPVSNALARSLGVPIGALRELGAAGVISSRDVIRALQEAKDTIDRDFANTQATIGQSFTVFTNSLAEAIDKLDNATGISRRVAESLISIAQSLESTGQTIDEFSLAIGRITNNLIEFGKYVLIIASIIPAFRLLRVAIGGVVSTVRNLGQAFSAMFSAARGGLQSFLNYFKNVGKELKNIEGVGKKVESVSRTIFPEKVVDLVKDNLGKIAIGLGAVALTAVDAEKKVKELFSDETVQGARAFQAEVRRVDNAIIETAKNAETRARSKFREMFDVNFEKQIARYRDANKELERSFELQSQLVGLSDFQANLIKAQADAFKPYSKELDKVRNKYQELEQAAIRAGEGSVDAAKFEAFKADYPARLREIALEYLRTSENIKTLITTTEELTRAENFRQFGLSRQAEFTEKLQGLQDEMAKITMSEIEKKYYDIEAAANASARAAIRAEEARRGSPLSIAEQKRYYDEARKGNDLLKLQTLELYENSRTFETGWRKAFQEYADEATNAAKIAERIFEKTTKGMEDAIVGFAKTGKFEFKSFLNSILEDLLRSQVRQLMAQIFGLNGGGPGFFGSVGKLLGFANGGIIPTNSPVLVGERGPEILSGAAGRVVTPNEQLGLGTTNVIYNISAVDARSFRELVASDPGFIYAVTEQGRRTIPSTRR
jgi:tape measure domain-containing protein